MERAKSRRLLTYFAIALGGVLLVALSAMQSAKAADKVKAKDKGQGDGQGQEQLTAFGLELRRVEAEIDKIFADGLAQSKTIPNDSGHRLQQIQTLGTLLLFDRQLSVLRNTACTSCHMPYTGF